MKRLNVLYVCVLLMALVLIGWAALPAKAAVSAQASNRLLIKNGTIEVEVADTDTAVTTAQSLIGFNGYILEQQVWDDDNGYRYATLTFGVPAEQFEETMRAFRTLGLVLDESVTGRDVTDQVVDLESQLANLYDTQARMRTYLQETRDITETLRVNQELVAIEQEIGDLQGQVNYLRDRAGSATITLRLVPFIPTPTPQPTNTPTPTPTATPLPTPEVWRPGDTARTATVKLQNSVQKTADFAIYRLIICGPWILAWVGLTYAAWRLARRYKRERP